jgi:8-oxo-dGTP pyrophosphatase MutT (NUDIX family)
MERHLPDPDLAVARRILEGYRAPDRAQDEVRSRILAFVEAHPEDAHLRSCLEGHLTASAMLMDHAGERVLLTLHRKLGLWLQLGGHCDGDANLVGAALREAHEESGIEGIEIDPEPLDLDIHLIPAYGPEGPAHVPAHLHLDTRFVAFAPAGSVERLSEESLELRWFGLDELAGLGCDASMLRAARRVRERLAR